MSLANRLTVERARLEITRCLYAATLCRPSGAARAGWVRLALTWREMRRRAGGFP